MMHIAASSQIRLHGEGRAYLRRNRAEGFETARVVRCRDRHEPSAVAGGPERGVRRLKMAARRRVAPELLVTTQTRRWNPEEFLRALAEAEITARDASTVRTRMRQAAFPAAKILAEFDVAATSVPPATFDYLSSAEWIRAAENVCMIGPAGTGKGNTMIALRIAAVEAGHRVRYFTALSWS